MGSIRSVGILIFDDVEVLDFCGPFEVFSVTTVGEQKAFNVFTVAESRPITARNGLSVNPTYLLEEAPSMDILVIPGGHGTRPLLENARLLDWIKSRHSGTELTVSVCTGSLLLAKAGLLEGLEATTHHATFDLLGQLAPNTRVRRDLRVVDNGKIIASGGISAGIDMAFHVVSRLMGDDVAVQTATYMEYDWSPGKPAIA
jgi:transcriptional regulator GlxA family with amidase domain